MELLNTFRHSIGFSMKKQVFLLISGCVNISHDMAQICEMLPGRCCPLVQKGNKPGTIKDSGLNDQEIQEKPQYLNFDNLVKGYTNPHGSHC